MTLEYILPGALLIGLGVIRLVLEDAWRSWRVAALLGYAAVGMGLVLFAAGLSGA